MAKLFKQSTFLFVFLGLLCLAKDHGTAANKHKEEIAAATAAGAASVIGALKAGTGAGAGASGTVGATAKAGTGAAASASSTVTTVKTGTGASTGASGASGSLGAGISGAIAGLKGAADAAVTTGTGATANGAAAVDGCACNDKFSEFLNKVLLILRYYTSKELGPELEALAVRFVEFFFSHLAAEKPEVMAKIHGFLQNSVQVTGAAVTKIGKA